MSSRSRSRFIFWACTGYVVLASLWIFLSDRWLALLVGPERLALFSTAKGFAFVVVTASLLFIALKSVPPESEVALPAMNADRQRLIRGLPVALLIPFAACSLQLLLWDLVTPYAWLLFIPATFVASWIGGVAGGIGATLFSTLLAWYFFLSPRFSFELDTPQSIYAAGMFLSLGLLFTLTHERLRHAERRASDQRFRGLVEQSLVGMYVIEGGRFRYVNPGFARIFGHADPESLIDRVAVGELVAPEDRERVAENIRLRTTGQAPDLRYAFTGLRADGERVAVEVHGRSFALDGKPAVIGVILDVSEQNRAREAIQQLNAELETRVQQRTAELQAANAELDSFAYAVSHDLRAPLRALSGFSQALIEDYGDRLDGEARVYLDQIVLASRRMGELVDGLLALSRSTRGELEREPVDVSALANAILAELAAASPSRSIKVEVQPGMSTRGDPGMIELVLRNLLDNAWKYTSRNPAAEIGVFARRRVEAGGAEVSEFLVRDNGAGFDPAHAGRLFQPFQRMHRQDEFPGIGIGLATVQRIVRRHGGEITANARPGQGATFSFTLAAPEIRIGASHATDQP